MRPLGFSLSDRAVKRSGLDYWAELKLTIVDDFETWLKNQDDPVYFLSSKVKTPYASASFSASSILVFGQETSGLPESLHKNYPSSFLTIPMKEEARSLNLSNAVAIVLYEALRQNGFSFQA